MKTYSENVVDISFIVIGYNEGKTLRSCLESVKSANLEGLTYELVYVDGGSGDDSIEITKDVGVDQLLGGDRRRKAAENRNLGLKAATGRFVQFLDGDMKIHPEWVPKAHTFLKEHQNVVSVCGDIKEAGNGFFQRVLQIDWSHDEGEVRHCGGAALWRREVILKMGGFPEDVSYGEEPYLCWRVRNELGMKIYYFNQHMVDHYLGFSGFSDYWRRDIRCGETYAEIAMRCFRSQDRLYLKETVSNFFWGTLILIALILLILGSTWLRLMILFTAILILGRKSIQIFQKCNDLRVSLFYALHIYFSKLPLTIGGLSWLMRRLVQNRYGTGRFF